MAKNMIKVTTTKHGSCWFWHRWALVMVFGQAEYFVCRDCGARHAKQPKSIPNDIQLSWVFCFTDVISPLWPPGSLPVLSRYDGESFFRVKNEVSMPIYRKKPVEIEAVQWTGYNRAEILHFAGNAASWGDVTGLTITTLEGKHIAAEGDYIIKGVAGEFYPCKPDIFAATYEQVIQPTAE